MGRCPSSNNFSNTRSGIQAAVSHQQQQQPQPVKIFLPAPAAAAASVVHGVGIGAGGVGLNNQHTRSKRNMRRTGTGDWTAEEDERLVKAVELHGSKNWKAIAKLVGTRNFTQCNQVRVVWLVPEWRGWVGWRLVRNGSRGPPGLGRRVFTLCGVYMRRGVDGGWVSELLPLFVLRFCWSCTLGGVSGGCLRCFLFLAGLAPVC